MPQNLCGFIKNLGSCRKYLSSLASYIFYDASHFIFYIIPLDSGLFEPELQQQRSKHCPVKIVRPYKEDEDTSMCLGLELQV